MREKIVDKDDLTKRISELLQDAQKKLGISSTEISHRAGITRSTYSQYRQGHILPALSRLKFILECIDLTIPPEIEDGYHAVISDNPHQGQLDPGYRATKTEAVIQFIHAWRSSKSISEVMKKTGLKRTQVYHRAKICRKNGISLPTKRCCGYASLDWDYIKEKTTDD